MWSKETRHLPSSQPLNRLLCHRGLLTVELAKVYGADVVINLLRTSKNTRGDLIRHVAIVCGGEALIYAETLIPAKTLTHLPWLANLAEKPLGAQMAARGDIARGDYTYALLSDDDSISQRMAEVTGLEMRPAAGHWARRYDLSLDACAVKICEVFLIGNAL